MAEKIKGSVFLDGVTYREGQEKELATAMKASKDKSGKPADFSEHTQALRSAGAIGEPTAPQDTMADPTLFAASQRKKHGEDDGHSAGPFVPVAGASITQDYAAGDGTAVGAGSTKGKVKSEAGDQAKADEATASSSDDSKKKK